MSGRNFQWRFARRNDENDSFDTVVDMASPAKHCWACLASLVSGPGCGCPLVRSSLRRRFVPGCSGLARRRHFACVNGIGSVLFHRIPGIVRTRIRPRQTIPDSWPVVPVRYWHPVVVVGLLVQETQTRVVLRFLY